MKQENINFRASRVGRLPLTGIWKIGRVAYGSGLENHRTAMYREFESLIFRNMKNIWFILGMCLCLLTGCKVIKYVPVKETEYVHVKDSVYLKDTTIQYKIEKQYVKDYTGLLDTLRLETDYAESEAYIDTTSSKLVGSIRNKPKILDINTQIKERIVVKDSILYKEVPVPVEVEKKIHYPYEKWLWVWAILSTVLIALIICFKIRKWH